MLGRLLPEAANNDYRGSRIALYVFPAVALLMLGRSLIHLFKDDSGVNSIASIITFSGDPDPNRVIYMFSSLWGGQQLIMVMLYGLVLWRYRNLIPLMYAFLVIEVCFRLLSGALHGLTPAYYEHEPPGSVGNVPGLILFGAMLALSLRAPKSDRASATT